ncbi:MAG: GAF domain-containing protein [Neisseria sp.]|nr:GAF domain-containing protein [Neisseria sp.]
MHHLLFSAHSDKATRYQEILPQIQAIIADENDLIANLANIAAILKESFNWFWVGFYLVKNEELVLAPFQGPLACTRIAHGRGVCGQAWQQAATIVVPDVNAHPDHIACSSLSQSEIVVPLKTADGIVHGVLDVDADTLNQYDETDAHYLEQIAALLAAQHFA